MKHSFILILFLLPFYSQSNEKAKTLQSILDGFKQRVEEVFKAESGRPLKRASKKPPIKKLRSAYTRAYSYSIIAFASRCYYLGEDLKKADAAIAENAQYYLDNPDGIHDRDSFHWHAEITMRLIEMYGSKGTHHAGRMSPETEKLALEPIWQYASKAWLKKAATDEQSIWHQYGSENHHAMDFTINWHFAKLAKDRPEYKNRKYEDGSSIEQQCKAWNKYVVAYCQSRAKKSLCNEMRSDGYNSTLIKGFYNFYDFGSPEVKAAAGLFLDLYFAYWAEEQIDGHMGGGASRIKGSNAFKQGRVSKNSALAWFYFGMGKKPTMVFGHDIGAMTSSYRPPLVVADIALDVKGRGNYEVRQRAQGLAERGNSFPVATAKQAPTKFRIDGGGILRYSYCTPDFIIGTPMVEARPLDKWAGVSSQSRWQGAIFSGPDDPRIVPIVRPKDNQVCFNSFWSVQSKGSLISQKLKTHKGAAEMMVFISEKGFSDPIEKDNMVFFEAQNSFAVIRVPIGGYKWQEKSLSYTAVTGGTRKVPPGKSMLLNKEFSPVILEVMSKSKIGTMEAFQKKLQASKPEIKGKVLAYKTIYGDILSLDMSYKKVPSINGTPVNYTPKKVYDSPFIQSLYDSGVVTIQKGNRSRILDFNNLTATDKVKE